MEQEMLNRLWELLGHAEQVFPPRRERIATAVLQGILASDERHEMAQQGVMASEAHDTARLAVQLADALIAELDKP